MPLFDYRAIAPTGQRQRGVLSADNTIDLLQQLNEAGLALVTAREVTPLRRALRMAPNVRLRELRQLFELLLQLTQARLPLMSGLSAVSQSVANRTLREAIDDIATQLARGRPLSLAMGTHPKVFGPVLVALVGAGERSGRLDIAFAQCKAHVEWLDHAARRLVRTMSYPILLAGLAMGVMILLTTWLAPRLLVFLNALDHEPGPMTLSLIAFSAVVQRDGATLLAGLAAAAALAAAGYAGLPPLARAVDRLLLKLPLVGRLLVRHECARFAHFMGIGISSGLAAQQAYDIACTVVRNRHLRLALAGAGRLMAEGQPMAEALAKTGLMNALMLEALRSGQLTDRLDESFATVSTIAGEDAADLTDRVTTLLPPAMLLMVGALLAWIVLGLILPIYETLSLEKLIF